MKITRFSLPAVIVTLIFLGGVFVYTQKTTNYNQLSPVAQITPSISLISTSVPSASLSQEMYKYTNTRLGFSMLIPNKISVYKSCGNSEYVNKKVGVYEDGESVYVAPTELLVTNSTSYDLKESDCQTQNTAASLFKDYQNIKSNFYKIESAYVKNESDILGFIQKQFGRDCTVSKKTPNTNNVTDITVGNTMTATSLNPNCLVNYAYAIKYIPSKSRIYSWTIGHEPQFQLRDEKTNKWTAYDEEMENSFQ